MITIQLCKRNSTGNLYLKPTVVEIISVETEDEAREILARSTVNGFYYRRVD